MNWLARAWDWYVNLVDKLPKKPPGVRINRGMLRYNLEDRMPGGSRDGAGLHLTNAQCADILAILNELEGK